MPTSEKGTSIKSASPAWLPWGLINFERIRRGENVGGIGLTINLTLAFFAGHAQEVLYFVVILSAWLLAACVADWKSQSASPRKLLGTWCLVGFAVIGLTAVELIPIYAYTKQAVRSTGLTVEAAARFSLNSSSLWQLLDPMILGGPEQKTLSGRFYWETVCHFGLAMTFLAGLGILTSWHRPEARRITLTLAFCTLFGLGTHTPFFSLMFHGVPGISFFRGSSRILMHLSLFVSLLAGLGIQSLAEAEPQSRSHRIASWGLGLSAGIVCLICALNPLGWEFHPPDVSTARQV